MKSIVALAFIIVGVSLGLYLGGWVCFVGGIVDIIQEIKAPVTSAGALAWGIAKVLAASVVGWGIALIGFISAKTALK